LPAESPTTAAIPTEVLPVATTDTGTGTGTGAGTGGLPGMPTTGQSDNSLLVTLILVALGLVGIGALASRTKGVNR
jgi:LPXTG-motif cell wall-anchored protein